MKPTTAMLIALALFAASPQRSSAAITNPLMPDSILFVAGGLQGGHQCDQYYGCCARSGGGLYLLTGARSDAPKTVDILANSKAANGPMAGKALTGGSFMSCELSYDAKTIYFAWVQSPGNAGIPGGNGEGYSGSDYMKDVFAPPKCWHIFKVNVDGSNLTQLTDGPYCDFSPSCLPNGRICFISMRRGGFGRCHPYAKPTFTLYSMKDDGSDIICISFHETNQWDPSVTNDGMIVFNQWDYIDRDDCIAQNMWVTHPDGRDPRAPSGNYPVPWSTMDGQYGSEDGRNSRPCGEWGIRAIPNSTKYVAISAGHHASTFGDICIIDPSIPDDNRVSQIKMVTTVKQGPWTFCEDCGGPYATPWPLSEDWFLANKGSTLVLINSSGQEQVFYTGTANKPTWPIPFRPRTKPPAIATQTWQEAARVNLPDHFRATISVMNSYYSDQPLPAGTKISAIRIMQLNPKSTFQSNDPVIGYACESLPRMCLGTVPVDPDGSAYFEAPVGKLIYFQLIDDKGMAVMSMRAGTYVHPGEQLTCYGCHEDKWKATPAANPTAIRRAPSPLKPEAGAESNGVTPINFHRLVKPTFTGTCVPCHQKQGKGPANMAYGPLQPYVFYWPSTTNNGDEYPPYIGGATNGDILYPYHGGSRTTPGKFGAAFSRMGKALLNADHQATLAAGTITQDQYRRVVLWLDANSNELCANTRVAEQQSGQLIWPELDYDPANPTGVELNLPPPGTGTIAAQPMFAKRPRAGIDKLVINGRVLELVNPCAGMVRVRVCDAAGRAIVDERRGGQRISMRLPASRGVFLVTLFGADGRLVKKAQAVSL